MYKWSSTLNSSIGGLDQFLNIHWELKTNIGTTFIVQGKQFINQLNWWSGPVPQYTQGTENHKYLVHCAREAVHQSAQLVERTSSEPISFLIHSCCRELKTYRYLVHCTSESVHIINQLKIVKWASIEPSSLIHRYYRELKTNRY